MKRLPIEDDRFELDFEVAAFDIALLALVPLGVVLFEILASPSLKSRLTHEVGSSTPLALFGHAFVHYSVGDVVWNVLGFLVLASVGYVLAVRIGERTWFFLSLVTIVATVPVVAGIVDGFVFESVAPATTISIRGLSAVVGGVAGLLFVVYLGVLRRVYDYTAVVLGGSAISIALVAVFADGYATVPRAGIYALPIVAFAILGVEGLRRTGWTLSGIRRGKLRVVLPITGLATVTLLVAVVAMFPENPNAGRTFTNVFGHAVGWTVGIVVSWWGHRYWTGVSWD